MFRQRYISVFLFSLSLSAVALLLERAIGIDWDYHPDSITYATVSSEMAQNIWEGDRLQIFNNGYYILVAFLGENVPLVTSCNMVLFAITNVLLYGHHSEVTTSGRLARASFLLLLMNPYRLHLSTTMLKDTLVIFLTVYSALGAGRYLRAIVPLLMVRVVAILYMISMLKTRRQAALFSLIAATIAITQYEPIIAFLLQSNDYEMVLRSFDTIPTFQEYGAAGIGYRALTWSIFALTGLFVVLSPALEYFPVAVGSAFNQIYCWIHLKRPSFPIGIIVTLMLFAALAPGFTAFIRYVYPVMTLLPIVAVRKDRPRLVFEHYRKASLQGGL